MIIFLYNTITREVHNRIWKKKHAPRLEQFRNIHKGEDCFIIGNGPSLNKMNLSLLNDHYTFGLNKIYMIFKKNPFKPSYHVAVNPLVIEQGKNEFRTLGCPSFLSFRSMSHNKIAGKNTFALGDINSTKSFHKDITKGISQGSTVTFTAMQIAYFMGFERVFLIGVDHNFFQQGLPNEKQKMQGDDLNHFDPNYFKGQDWQLADLENSEVSYLIAKYYFDKKGGSIQDATVEGKLTIFDKIKFEDALALAKKKR